MLANFCGFTGSPVQGPVLLNAAGLPRYWAAVWASFLPADLAPSTLGKKLGQLEAFYQHTDEALGIGRLDDALAEVERDWAGAGGAKFSGDVYVRVQRSYVLPDLSQFVPLIQPGWRFKIFCTQSPTVRQIVGGKAACTSKAAKTS